MMDLLDHSCKIHRSLHPELKLLPPILSSGALTHIHKVCPRVKGRSLGNEPAFSGVVFAKNLSKKNGEALAGSLDTVEWKYRKLWADGGDHFLLKEILENGLVPTSSWPQMQFSTESPKLDIALRMAKKRGYIVPDSFLEETNVPHGEAELFYAAMYMAIEYSYDCFRWGRDDVSFRQSWRKEISSITGQFVIPDPLVDWKCPFVIDQLWIINDGSRVARLIAIEVDGAHHLDAGRKEKDRARDVKLNELGYQVIHVNEVWCKVDPFRVVAEIIREIGLCQDFADAMVGGNLSSPDDYICALCGNPMARFEDNSIREVFSGRDVYLVHSSCLDRMREEKYETGISRFELTPDY